MERIHWSGTNEDGSAAVSAAAVVVVVVVFVLPAAVAASHLKVVHIHQLVTSAEVRTMDCDN